MTIQELQKIEYTYVRITENDTYTRYTNDNFDELLIFIGNHFPTIGRTPIGSAYVKIRKETDKLLHVSWPYNQKLKTSKREIISIRRSFYWLPTHKGEHYYTKIPYKIGFIFTAIVNIISEIAQKESIPASLNKYIGKTYSLSFYNHQIELYDIAYRRGFRTDATTPGLQAYPVLLYDVFHAPASVFARKFP